MTAPQVIGLGCRLNIAESERIGAMLAGDGDIVVINSCAVTGEAVRQTRRAVRKARREHPRARLLVTGCAAETERAALAAMPEVDALVPNAAKLLPQAYGMGAATLAPAAVRTRTRAFVAIQNGCDHSCTFCIIPQGRGPSRSLHPDAVFREIEAQLARSAREIVLTGVDVTSWGGDLAGTPRLGDLVTAILARFPELPRLRLSSLDGAEIDPLLHEAIASEARIMPHLHLSLQHGHDLILKRMKRRHTRTDAARLVIALKRRRPDIAIGADLIAGFPTESEEHHAAIFRSSRSWASSTPTYSPTPRATTPPPHGCRRWRAIPSAAAPPNCARPSPRRAPNGWRRSSASPCAYSPNAMAGAMPATMHAWPRPASRPAQSPRSSQPRSRTTSCDE